MLVLDLAHSKVDITELATPPSTWFLGFAAIRLAVLEEPDSEEDVIFNQRPRPPNTGWSLDTEDTNPEDTQHRSRPKSKVAGKAQSDVAFSSLLVRRSLGQGEKADI